MARPTKHTEASVEISFNIGDSNYSVDRAIKEGGASAYLRADNKLVESGSERVTEAVEKLVHADYELFSRAIYSEQNNLDYFLTLGKGERKKQIDQLLGIDRLESARANATTLLNRIRAKRDEALGFLQGVDYAGVQDELKRTLEQESSLQKSL